MDDIILNKTESIERCVKRVRDTFSGNESKLTTDYTVQDVIILNLHRACEAAIDIAMHVVKIKKLGIPKDSREAFTLLGKADLIPKKLAAKLEKMVGFRNIIIHGYTEINYDIVRSVLTDELESLTQFSQLLMKLSS